MINKAITMRKVLGAARFVILSSLDPDEFCSALWVPPPLPTQLDDLRLVAFLSKRHLRRAAFIVRRLGLACGYTHGMVFRNQLKP